ncbi:MAG: hypothetical protein NXI31_08635 [bacterium]|nr:hypothetical protein [bacterium]
MATTPEIEIRIGPVEVTCRGDVDREQLDGVLQSLRSQLPELMAPRDAADQPSPRELLARSSAKTHGDKAGVIAFWLETHCGRSEWRSSDIVDALSEAGEELPKNITDTLNQKRDKNLLEVHDRRF